MGLSDADTLNIEGLSNKEVALTQKRFLYNELPNCYKNNFIKIIISILGETMIATVVICFILVDRSVVYLLRYVFF